VWVLPLVLGLAWVQWNGYEGLNGADSHDYFRGARAWAAWLHGGERPPAAEHPAAFPLSGALLGTATGDILMALRCIPFLSFLLIGLTMLRLVPRQRLEGPVGLAFVLVSVVASPFLLRHALVVMSDVPAAALVFISFAALVVWRERGSAKWFVLAMLAGASAVAFRFAAVPVLGGAALWLIWEKGVGRRAWMIRAGIGLGLLLVAGLFTFRPVWLAEHCAGTPIEHWSGLNLFRTEHHSDDGVLRYRVPNILYVVSVLIHPGFLPIGSLLLPFIRRADFRTFGAGLAVFMLVAYLFFTAGLPFQNDRVMLMAQPFVAYLFAPAFGRAWAWLGSKRLRPWLVVGAIAVVQMGLFSRAIHPFMRNARIERELAGAVREAGARQVYTHGMGPALSNYCPGVEVTELWYGRIDRFESGALVLVNPKNLEEQWQGLPPWENWSRVQQQGVEGVEMRPDGWVLVRVK
jgi:hypothetical protein